MASANLYESPVSYPTISAVDNGKLEFTLQDKLVLKMETADVRVVGIRGSTSDPWTIEIIREKESNPSYLKFGLPARSVNPDDLHWKSMADLAIKVHGRPVADQIWPAIEADNAPFVTADPNSGVGYKAATLAEINTILQLTVDEAGDFRLDYDSTKASNNTRMSFKGVFLSMVSSAVGHILSNSTDTHITDVIPHSLVDVADGTEVCMEFPIDMQAATGTEALSVGNYAYGKMTAAVQAGGSVGVAYSEHIREVREGEAMAIPTIVLDKLRRASKAGSTARVLLSYGGDAMSANILWSAIPDTGIGTVTALHASFASPSGFFEVDFDQANSLNVLATAAFAGLGGLAASGVATELQSLLTNSALAPIFQNVAAALGATTAAVITGYVSALVAAYTQGWIGNDQLFNLSNHVSWIQAGAQAIAGAAAAGVAIGELPTLLSYLGVSNNVLGVAMTAVGGAATGAGVALGMASVMAKCVRHIYWGA